MMHKMQVFRNSLLDAVIIHTVVRKFVKTFFSHKWYTKWSINWLLHLSLVFQSIFGLLTNGKCEFLFLEYRTNFKYEISTILPSPDLSRYPFINQSSRKYKLLHGVYTNYQGPYFWLRPAVIIPSLICWSPRCGRGGTDYIIFVLHISVWGILCVSCSSLEYAW